MRVYADFRLGPKQSRTPEGYLLCEDVPIARTGWMIYGSHELPDLEANGDGLILVYRDPADVFAPATLASFLGKPVVDDHPEENVSPDTWRELEIGTALNVRQGEGADADLMLADLLIKDPDAIEDIRMKRKLEISNGYDADYEQTEPGKARQYNIIGNHIALVDQARCGPRCAIGDSDMRTTDKRTTVWDRLARAFKTKDEKEFEDALHDARDAEEGEEGEAGTHIHLHTEPAEDRRDRRDRSRDGESEETEDAAPGWFDRAMDARMKDWKDWRDSVDKALDALSKDRRGKDAEPNGEEDPDGAAKDAKDKSDKARDGEETEDEFETSAAPGDLEEGNTYEGEGVGNVRTQPTSSVGDKTRDSGSAVERTWRETTSLAEILVPGIRLPTFDRALAKDTKKATEELCIFRKRVLARALTTDSAEFVIEANGGAPIIHKMSCDAARAVFVAAASLAKRSNNEGLRGHARAGTRDARPTGPVTAEDINERNKAFWKEHGGLVDR